ncbi:MAG: LPS-assembly protein LptD [Roseicyclus sp.]
MAEGRRDKTGAPGRLALALIAVLAVLAPGRAGLAQAPGASAAPPATLVADDILFQQGSAAITARGGVEVFFEGARLRAEAITYSQDGDRITVEGPLTLIGADGDTVMVAEFADLSADLRDGILRSARVVLDRQMQIAARRIDRVEGRYTQAYQAVASSCEVCFDNPVPLWEIRARRVIHDEAERQIYFEGAQFRVLGVPVVWLPQMRLPDPTLERATGFLAPSIRATDATGTQIRVPYFITLGDHADLTVTPWIGLGDSQTFELRYRQAFRDGNVAANGSVTWDDLTDEDVRGHVFANGAFGVGDGIRLTFRLQAVSDDDYLRVYGFPSASRLENDIRLSRAEAGGFFDLGLTAFSSLRETERDRTLPTQVFDGRVVRRLEGDVLGGIAQIRVDALGYLREEDRPGTLEQNGRPLATDAVRLSGVLDWRRSGILPGGIVANVETALAADLHAARQDVDERLNDTAARLTPYGAIGLRYPLYRAGRGDVSHMLEPVVHLAWSGTLGDPVVEEDNAVVEFDEGNLFSIDRFPGSDRREEGARAAVGLGYTRIDPAGWSAGLAAGLVLRAEDFGQFTPGSGLDGDTSDWLLVAHVDLADRLQLVNRALFDTSLEFTSNEFRVDWRGAAHRVGSTYTWLEADTAEGRPRDLGEWALDAVYRFDSDWTAGLDWRYDFAESNPTEAGLNLGYENECIDMEVSVSRRYSASASSEDITEFGFTVELNGYGAGRQGRERDRSCNR